MSNTVRFSASSEVLSALSGAGTRSPDVRIIVGSGDLHQMGIQSRFLQEQGMNIGHMDVYPAVATDEERERGLRLLWDHSVEGWWNLEHDFIKVGVCTQEEFDAKLGRD